MNTLSKVHQVATIVAIVSITMTALLFFISQLTNLSLDYSQRGFTAYDRILRDVILSGGLAISLGSGSLSVILSQYLTAKK